MTGDRGKPAGLREAADAMRAGRLSCVDYTRALLARIAARDGEVRAWAWLEEARALSVAEGFDARLRAGAAPGPLHGVPVGVKDIVDTRGIPTENGSAVCAGRVPKRSATVVDLLERAGGWVLGKTVTTEFAYMTPGKTCNPWNPQHTPGGSSSGSAAAVAAGFVPAAIGTQTNGSVIRPAAFCGVVGFKPGHHVIPFDGVHPFSQTLDHAGVFARSVADAALLAACLAREPGRIPGEVRAPDRPPRLLAVRMPVWHLADQGQRARFAADLARLRDAGAEVEETELPEAFERAHPAHRAIMLHEAARNLKDLQARHRDALSDFLNRSLDEGRAISMTAYWEATHVRSELRGALARFLDGRDAILSPPATGEAPAGLGVTGDPSFCTLWSLTGVPAIAIPTGLGPRGLPLGLQIAGAEGSEGRVLEVAAWCEAQFGFRGLE